MYKKNCSIKEDPFETTEVVPKTPSTLNYSQSSSPFSRNDTVNPFSDANRLNSATENILSDTNELEHTCEDQNLQAGSRSKNPFIFFRKADIVLLVPAIAFNALSAGTHVAITIMMERIFNKLNSFQHGRYPTPQAFIDDLKWSCFSIVFFGCGGWIFGGLETFFFSYLGERQQIRCRRLLYRSLLARNYSWFESKKNLDGELIQLNRSVEEFRTAISEYFSLLCSSVFLIFAMSITSFIYSWRLTLLVLALFPLMFVIIFIFGNIVEKWAKVDDKITSMTISHIDWNLLSFSWIKIINSKMLEIHKMNKFLAKCEFAYRKFAFYTNIIGSSLSTLSLMMFVQSFWFGSWLIKKEYNTAGEIMAAFYACLNISMTIASLSVLTVVFQKASASFDKVMSFILDSEMKKLDKPLKIDKNGESLPFDLDGEIYFHNVSFNYVTKKEKSTLTNINFRISKNRFTFIVGVSGSGKSTIASLLTKLYAPKTGEIIIDGFNLEYLDDAYLRSQITLVQQFPTLFNDTFKNNLLLGLDSTSIEPNKIYDSILMFNLSEVIKKLPNGMDTFLGSGEDSTVQLSGGEEQRLNLARAKLRDPPILILDESVSAIDIYQRYQILQKIRTWRKGKTTIAITHELGHINPDDNVIVLEKGELIESGLMKNLALSNDKEGQFENDANIDDLTNMDETKTYYNSKTGIEKYDYLTSVTESINLVNSDDANKKENSDDEMTSMKAPIFTAYNLVVKIMPFKYRLLYLVGLALSIVAAISNSIFAFFISKLINGIIPVSLGGYMTTHEQLKWSMAATSIAIGQGLFMLLSSVALSFASERFCRILRIIVFKKILNQNMTYFENIKANEVSTLLMNDIRDLRNVVTGTMSHIICGIAISLCCIVWTLTIGWKYALVGFSMFPLYGLFSIFATLLMQKFEFKYKSQLNTLEEYIHDTRMGIRTILCLNLKLDFITNFETNLNSVLNVGLQRAFAMGCASNLATFVSGVCQAILYFYGLSLVANGEYNLISMTQIVMMITMSTAYIAQIMSSASAIYRGLRVALKLDKILKLNDDRNESMGHLTPKLQNINSDRVFELKNVSFAYPSYPFNFILKNVNVNFPKNSIISLTGESGCGKSTMVALFLRLYELNSVNGGEILLNGLNINSIKLEHLRNSISVVSQKHYFFDGTIRENLLYSHPRPETIDDKKILETLEKLDLLTLVNDLPAGLDSSLGVSRQLLVSGGQIQRLSIARALLRQSSILILDECTSSLDEQNALKVMNLLQELKREKCIICITHNKEVMKKSDVIFFLRDGRIVENGSYEALMKLKSHFFEMIYTGI